MDPSAIWLPWPKLDSALLALCARVLLLLAILNLIARAAFSGLTRALPDRELTPAPRTPLVLGWAGIAAAPLLAALAAFALGFPGGTGAWAATLALTGEAASRLLLLKAPHLPPGRRRATRTVAALLPLAALHFLLAPPAAVSLLVVISWVMADRLLAFWRR